MSVLRKALFRNFRTIESKRDAIHEIFIEKRNLMLTNYPLCNLFFSEAQSVDQSKSHRVKHLAANKCNSCLIEEPRQYSKHLFLLLLSSWQTWRKLLNKADPKLQQTCICIFGESCKMEKLNFFQFDSIVSTDKSILAPFFTKGVLSSINQKIFKDAISQCFCFRFTRIFSKIN